jgi:hypothetical protein
MQARQHGDWIIPAKIGDFAFSWKEELAPSKGNKISGDAGILAIVENGEVSEPDACEHARLESGDTPQTPALATEPRNMSQGTPTTEAAPVFAKRTASPCPVDCQHASEISAMDLSADALKQIEIVKDQCKGRVKTKLDRVEKNVGILLEELKRKLVSPSFDSGSSYSG